MMEPALIRSAVADGFRDVLRDKELVAEFWDGAFDHLQQRATRKTGAFVLGGVKVMLARLWWIVLLGAAIYTLGGPAALLKAIGLLKE